MGHFAVFRGYKEMAKAENLQQVEALIHTDLESHNLSFVRVKRVKTTIKDRDGVVHNAWYYTYQYNTLYFENYFVIENKDGRMFKAL